MGKKRTAVQPAMVRQGDVLLVPVGRAPKRLERVHDARGIVLAEGEATGHAHRVVGDAVLYVRPDSAWLEPGPPLLVVEGDARLVHEEHDPIRLARGTYEVRRQREYSGSARDFLWVAD